MSYVTHESMTSEKNKVEKNHHHHTSMVPYKTVARSAWDDAWRVLWTPDGWRNENHHDLNAGFIQSQYFEGVGKVFKLEGYVEASPYEVFDETVLHVETAPTWNPTVVISRTLQKVDDCTDIHYNVTAAVAGGIISSRDFINLRHWETRDDVILSAGCAVEHPDMPASKKHVRGVNGPGGWFYKPVPDNPNRCIFGWLVNTDIKGWIPQKLVEQAITGMLIQFLGHLRQHMHNVKSNRKS